MLIGIVVTNAIVLLDLVERLRTRGHPRKEALIEGGKTRVRPILMTAIATILALIPLAAGFNQGSIIAAELGTVVIGGLFCSTFLTLLVVPVVYSLVAGAREALARRRGVVATVVSGGRRRGLTSRSSPRTSTPRAGRSGRRHVARARNVLSEPSDHPWRLPMGLTSFAESSWTGDLATGSGSIDYVSSGAFTRMPVSWAARTQEHKGKTSPEELLRRGSCVVLLDGLRRAASARTAPRRSGWRWRAEVTFDQKDGGWGAVTKSSLTVQGRGRRVSKRPSSRRLAEDARDNCPISQALEGQRRPRGRRRLFA